MQRLVTVIAGATIVLAGAAALFFALKPAGDGPVSAHAMDLSGADIGGAFELTSHEGERVTSAEVIDGPTLVYFGYTFCPDICPVDAQVMAEAVDVLAERSIEVTPVFVTIDPARDTPEQLGYFVEGLHPEMIGLTGGAEEIRAAADAYKVYYSKVEMEGSAADYLMDHTTHTYLAFPDGVPLGFRRGAPAEEIAAEVERAVERRG